MILELINKKRFDILLLMVAAFFPIYRYSFSAVILPVFLVTSIILFFYNKRKFDKSLLNTQVRYLLVSTGFYWLMVVGLIYTSNIANGLSILLHGMYLLLYPVAIIFFVGEISKKHFNQIMLCFMIACCVYLLYMHYRFYVAGLYTNFRRAEFNELPFRQELMTLKFGSIHPTYISMWFMFSVLYMIHYLFENRVRLWVAIVMGLVALAFTGSTVLLSVKITVLAFFFSLLILLYLKVKNKLTVLVSYGLLGTIFLLAIFNISFLRARFIDEFQLTELKPPVGLNTNSINVRVGIYKCSMDVFSNNWLIGTGAGDLQDELNKCYDQFDTNVYKEAKYDTHSSFLFVGIATGSIGLLAFICMFGFHIKESIKRNNDLFIVFIVFVIICMLPETILNRNHGIVFYAIFSSLFMKINLENGKSYEFSKR